MTVHEGRRPGRRGGLRRREKGAQARARGKGPVFLLAETYRLTGHYIGDPQVYRPKEEVRELRQTQDPVTKCAREARALRLRLGGDGRGDREDRRGVRRVLEAGHRPEARGRPQERLRLMAELSYREAVRDAMSTRDEARTTTSSSWARTSPRWAARWASRRGCSRSSGPSASATRRSPRWPSSAPASAPRSPGCGPIVEIMYQDFTTLAMEQIVSQAAKHRYMSGGQIKVPHHDPHAGRRRLVAGRPARAAARGVVRARAGAQGRLPVHPRGRARPPLELHLRGQPDRLLRAPDAVRHQGRGPRRDRADRDRQGADPPRGRGRDRRRHGPARARVAQGGRAGRGGGDLRGGLRPAHAAAARRGRPHRLRQEDEPRCRRPRGRHADGLGRRGRGRRPGTGASTTSTRRSRASAPSSHRSRSRPSWRSGSFPTPRTCSRRSRRPSARNELPRHPSATGPGDGDRHDRALAEVRGRERGEGRAALRARHREGDAGGRGRGLGVLLKILAGEGEEIEVGKAIAVIGEQGEDVPEREAEDPTKVAEDDAQEEGSPRARAGGRA